MRIRVGSGGVMLPHYSPLKVAETFSLLAGLFPGRIDLGLGRAAGTDPMTDLRAAARPPPGGARRLPPAARRAARLSRRPRCPPTHPFARLAKTLPGATASKPEPWLLGSSPQSAIWAAELGPALRLCRLHQPQGRGDRGASTASASPNTNTRQASRAPRWRCGSICAESDEEARRAGGQRRA